MTLEEKVRAWGQMLAGLREHLSTRNYLEVQTDILVPAGAFEAAIDPFEVPGARSQLQTSPEMEMKALIAEMRTPVFQIARCFRNDPVSPVHRKEFTMLEFYLLGGFESLIEETKSVFEFALGKPLPWRRVSVTSLFADLGISLEEDSMSFRQNIEQRSLVATDPTDTWSDLFFRVFLEHIEPMLPPDVPTIVDGYPLAVSPLSQPVPSTSVAQRFEIYWRGLEVCNGCAELTDPFELERRWKDQNEQRRLRGAPLHPFPERLHQTLKRGLPDCSGVAVGLDRLFLLRMRERFGHSAQTLVDLGPAWLNS